MYTVLLAFAMAAAPVSYTRDIAPILSFHCHWCHGNRRQTPAGDLDTRTYQTLMRGGGLGDVVRPGDPARSLIVQFIEGKRGAGKRMPEKAPPLDSHSIATIRRWIIEGAKDDTAAVPRWGLTASGIRLDASRPIEIACVSPVRSYVLARIVDGTGKVWLTEEGPVQRPKGVHDLAAPGETIRWTVWPEKYWPRTVNFRLEILYAERPPEGAHLEVKSGAQDIRVRGPSPL